MASANVDLVKSIYADWERGDFSSAGWAHPEIEYVITDGPAPGSWTGRDGMAGAWRDFLRSWEEYRVKADEFRELDDERLLVLDHHRIGRGKTSGVDLKEMGPKGANLFHIHGGEVTRLVLYFDRERAFADLGLTSEAGSPRS